MSEQTGFSKKEDEVVDLLLQGKSNKQIAARLGITSRTVEFHLTNIYQKMGVASRSEAILMLTGRSAPDDLRQSTVEMGDPQKDIKEHIQRGGQPLKKRFLFLAGGIVLIAIVIYFILLSLFQPVMGNEMQTAVASVEAGESISPP